MRNFYSPPWFTVFIPTQSTPLGSYSQLHSPHPSPPSFPLYNVTEIDNFVLILFSSFIKTTSSMKHWWLLHFNTSLVHFRFHGLWVTGSVSHKPWWGRNNKACRKKTSVYAWQISYNLLILSISYDLIMSHLSTYTYKPYGHIIYILFIDIFITLFILYQAA